MNKTQKAAMNNNSKTNEALESEKDFNQASTSEELNKREKELNARELKFMAKQFLSQRELPTELADILKLDDEESVKKAVEMLARLSGEKENKLKVLDEKKLPEIKNEEKNISELRKAFGLIWKEF